MNADDGSGQRDTAELLDDRGCRFHVLHCSDNRNNVKQDVAILEIGTFPIRRYPRRMLSEWLQNALQAAGISQSEASRRLTEMLRRSIDRSALNKMVKGTREISADELIALEEITGSVAPRADDSSATGHQPHLHRPPDLVRFAAQLRQLSDADLAVVVALVDRLAAKQQQ